MTMPNGIALAVRRGASVVVCGAALGACSWLSVETRPPDMPAPLAPVEGAVLAAGAPARFVWSPVERATHYDFHLFDRESRDIERHYRAALDPDEVCDGDACAVSVVVVLPVATAHAWRVRAGNLAGKSTWTRTQFAVVERDGGRARER